MIDAPLAYAFGVGLVAAFNPCGFAMLPAYLSYFLGLEGAHPDQRASVLRALAVGLSVTLGFLVVFGIIGIVLKGSLDTIQSRLPWVTMLLGVVFAYLCWQSRSILPGILAHFAHNALGVIPVFRPEWAPWANLPEDTEANWVHLPVEIIAIGLGVFAVGVGIAISRARPREADAAGLAPAGPMRAN